jgi:glycosyltransferase involved in cell wall biosynthesis
MQDLRGYTGFGSASAVAHPKKANENNHRGVSLNMPAVSVASTVLNERDDIDALVESLMQQTLAPAEVIIVDGGSTDGTWERLEAARSKYPTLVPIRDESCNLQRSPGPIARGRNIATAAASSDVVACADAGCTYGPDWLANLTAPIFNGNSQYSVGGSYIDPTKTDPTKTDPTKTDPTNYSVWDVASAPFFGVKLNPDAATKSCTARSMAFRKELWQRVGGFPETVFLGEDTVFDSKVRKLVTPAFAERAKASYQPRHTFRSALRQMVGYSVTDGVLGGRSARLWRNMARCFVEILAALALVYSPIPLLCVLVLEVYFAFRLDWTDLRKVPIRTLGARLVFSLIVPWVVAWYQTVGSITKKSRPNRQNFTLE